MSAFDKGPPAAFARHFAAVPDPMHKERFWFDWGPVYYRGRLDGSARVLCIGSDPGATERIANRTLVGDAGQRAQGFLAKLGLTRSYLCLNAFAYGLLPSQADTAGEMLSEEAQLLWRNHLYDMAKSDQLQAVIAFGRVAQQALALWDGRDGLHVELVPHPSNRDERELLIEWTRAVTALRAKVAKDPDGDPSVPNYSNRFHETDYAAIPHEDLPFGVPRFLGDDSWLRARNTRASVIRPVPDDRHTLSWDAEAPAAAAPDAFERAYAAGVVVDEGLAPSAHERKAGVGLALAASGGYALGGCVLTPSRKIDPGYVVVGSDGTIAAVQQKKPGTVVVVETGGVILPGLLDLHNHPDFNIFAAWEPPSVFINRMQWRHSDLYKQLLRSPWNQLQAAQLDTKAARYAEIRALVGGTTAIQGASPQYPTEEALVRNVDKIIFGSQIGRSMVDLDGRALPGVLADIEQGRVKAFYIHCAEGQKNNQASHTEFKHLVDHHGLTPATVIIHGTALSKAELQLVRDAGAKLVWSPQSNLRLYDQTTTIEDVVALGIPWTLGADWLPSGSRSLLDEMRVARHEMEAAALHPTAEQLVRTVTADAAVIAGLEDKLGALEANKAADILVLERRDEDPWENVLSADPSWVDLVTIGGDLAYGRTEWLQKLAGSGATANAEDVLAWGKEMTLDTSYAVNPKGTPPTLRELRSSLIGGYPNVGPIFA
jgi:5-methylthioadenosine/S-adenosylhomocysteine deaminase